MSTKIVDIREPRQKKWSKQIGQKIREAREAAPLSLVSPVSMLRELEAHIVANGLKPLIKPPTLEGDKAFDQWCEAQEWAKNFGPDECAASIVLALNRNRCERLFEDIGRIKAGAT